MADYHSLSKTEKRSYHRERNREPAERCPVCGAAVLVADLLAHVERCDGPPEPHALSRWVTWREVMDMGVPKRTLSRWVRVGLVRVQGRRMGARDSQPRRYLLRDVTRQLAQRRATSGPTIDKGPRS